MGNGKAEKRDIKYPIEGISTSGSIFKRFLLNIDLLINCTCLFLYLEFSIVKIFDDNFLGILLSHKLIEPQLEIL